MHYEKTTFLAILVSVLALGCGEDSSPADGPGGGPGGKADDASGDGRIDPELYDFRVDDFDDYNEVVDGLGVAFSDTLLGRREDHFSQSGPTNYGPGMIRDTLKNFADFGVAFGRDFEAMGFDSCVNLNSVDANRTSERNLSLYRSFQVTKGCLFQRVRPEWGSLSPRTMDIFTPNHMRVDFRLVADGSLSEFPNGRRPDEQLASKFTALLLDLDGGVCEDDQGGPQFDGVRDAPCTVNSLQDGKLFWDLPLNPVENDVPFIRDAQGHLSFPYLPAPHGSAPY